MNVQRTFEVWMYKGLWDPGKFGHENSSENVKSLSWGRVFLERTRILSTTYFIDFFVVESKPFVSSFVNVILMRQACGQRSSKTAESKLRALENYFSERICYMFLTSKCRGDWDLGLCGDTCVTVPSTPMCPPSSTTSLTSLLAISSVRTKSCKVSWRRNWISRVKST